MNLRELYFYDILNINQNLGFLTDIFDRYFKNLYRVDFIKVDDLYRLSNNGFTKIVMFSNDFPVIVYDYNKENKSLFYINIDQDDRVVGYTDIKSYEEFLKTTFFKDNNIISLAIKEYYKNNLVNDFLIKAQFDSDNKITTLLKLLSNNSKYNKFFNIEYSNNNVLITLNKKKVLNIEYENSSDEIIYRYTYYSDYNPISRILKREINIRDKFILEHVIDNFRKTMIIKRYEQNGLLITKEKYEYAPLEKKYLPIEFLNYTYNDINLLKDIKVIKNGLINIENWDVKKMKKNIGFNKNKTKTFNLKL